MYIYKCENCRTYKHSLKPETCCKRPMKCVARYNVKKREQLRKQFEKLGGATFNILNHETNETIPNK